jgi:hypothetical protein
MRRFFALALLACLSACATLEKRNNPNPAQLLIGNWDNSVQMAAASEDLKRPPVAGGAYAWIDGQYATFFPVSVPALTQVGAKAIYLVWRKDGPTGPISRQRLWVFRKGLDGKFGMDFYAFKNPSLVETATADGEAFKALTLDDLTIYGPLCTLPIVPKADGWSASIPSTCAITARSGRKMVLSAEIVATPTSLSYREQGLLESGSLAFKVPGIGAYEFKRLKR